MLATLQRATAAMCLSAALIGSVLGQPAHAQPQAWGRKGAVSPYVDQETCRELRRGSDSANEENARHQFDPKEALDAAQLEAMRKIDKSGNENGSAAPNPEAEAMLGMLSNMFASRGDGNSQVASAWMKAQGITPRSSDSALGTIGCGTR